MHTWLSFCALYLASQWWQEKLKSWVYKWSFNRLNFAAAKYGEKKIQKVMWAMSACVISLFSTTLLAMDTLLGK